MKRNRKHLLFLLLFVGAAIIVPALLRAASQIDLMGEISLTPTAAEEKTDPTVLDSISEWTADSLRRVRTDSLMRLASTSYKDLQRMKVDQEDLAMIYPRVYEAYLHNLEALDEFTPDDLHRSQIREMLRSIDKDLEAGAYFYSSQGDRENLNKFAQAFIDVQLLPDFEGEVFSRNAQAFPTMVYIAAAAAFNAQEFPRAIEYFKLYLQTPELTRREAILESLGQACLNAGEYDYGIKTLSEALTTFPDNRRIPVVGVKLCVAGGRAESMQPFLTAALSQDPDNEQLLNIQGKLYEDRNEYKNALEVYYKLDLLSPQSMSVAKHTALCYYNIGVAYFNMAINERDEKAARKLRSQSKNYFVSATQKLQEIVASDPLAVKYLKALGVSYLLTEQKDQFEDINRRLVSLGEDALAEVFMPPMLTYNDNNAKNYDYVIEGGGVVDISDVVPLYSEFGRDYITEGMARWAEKGEFEKNEDYTKRINGDLVQAEYQRLNNEAQAKYLEKYAKKLRLTDLKLQPYDANNETFLIESSYGPIYVKVPLKNNEAETFKANWEGVRFRNPSYVIADDKVRISGITIVTPSGKSYTYDNKEINNYSTDNIYIDFGSILAQINAPKVSSGSTAKTGERSVTVTRESDVDVNIPVTSRKADKTFAVVIANEAYRNVDKVESALHDGDRFADYCRMTLGIPEENVLVFRNATFGNMHEALSRLANAVKAYGSETDVIFYYAGHGFPDENTRDAYLLPVDGSPTISSTSLSLKSLIETLNAMNANSVVMFLDACFSGTNRDGTSLYAARGVAIAPRASSPRGNMFMLSATSDNETAMPYRDKNHGLFTYFLLKKLQDSKGNVTLKDLSEYVIDNVAKESLRINRKPQNPTLQTSGRMATEYRTHKLRK